MHITVAYDGNTGDLPQGFVASLQSAVDYLTNNIKTDVNFTLHVGYGSVHGNPLNPGASGQFEPNFSNVSFTDFINALKTHATSADDQAAIASLATNPLPNGTQLKIAPVEAVALGLQTGTPDVYIGFSKNTPFDYDNSNGVTGGTFDFEALAIKVITSAMGKAFDTTPGTAAPLQLFDYFAAPANGATFHQLNPNFMGYFSLDSGTTNLHFFDSANGSHNWRSDQGADAFNGFYDAGVKEGVSQLDLKVMDILGFDLGPTIVTPPPPPPPPPGGGSTPGQILSALMSDIAPTATQLSSVWPKFESDQLANYQKMGVADPGLGVYESWGLAFSSFAKFGSTFPASLTDANFAKTAWHDAWGQDPTPTQVQFVNDQVHFHEKMYADAHAYGADNPTTDIMLGRGATFGIIVGMAEEAGIHSHTV